MDDSRFAATRQAMQRPGFRPVRGRLDADLTGLPSDMEAVWVRESTLGADDEGNLEEAQARGLVPATTDMLPNNKPMALPGRAPPTNNLIRRGGQMLMVGLRAEIRAQRAYDVAEGHEQVSAAQRLTPDKGAEIDGTNIIESSQVSDRIQRRGPGRPPTRSKFAE